MLGVVFLVGGQRSCRSGDEEESDIVQRLPVCGLTVLVRSDNHCALLSFERRDANECSIGGLSLTAA